MKNNFRWKTGFWMAVITAIIMVVLAGATTNGYNKALEDLAVKQEYIDGLEWDLESARTHRDRYKADLDATPTYRGLMTRVEYLEGQLDSCNNAYSMERHERKYYQKALENVSPYCSEGMCQLAIDDLREELRRLIEDHNALLEKYHEARWERDRLQSELRGAPCHPHSDGIHCAWGPPTALYECAFGELGWIGPDRVMCSAFGNTSYNEAKTACFSDRNCSSCIQMTGGDLGHCYAFAYYPR